MVVGILSGTYMGLGINATTALDRNSEFWFGIIMWILAFAGVLVGGLVGSGMLLGTLVLVALWSFLHFPQIKTLETPMPRLLPLYIMSAAVAVAVLFGLAVALA
jgi:hypothetical protein